MSTPTIELDLSSLLTSGDHGPAEARFGAGDVVSEDGEAGAPASDGRPRRHGSSYCVASEQEPAIIFNDFTVNVRSGLLASADADVPVPAVPVGLVIAVAAR